MAFAVRAARFACGLGGRPLVVDIWIACDTGTKVRVRFEPLFRIIPWAAVVAERIHRPAI